MDNPIDLPSIEVRLVVIDPQSKRVLAMTVAEGFLLPRHSIPAYTRVANALTEAIEQRFGLLTIQLALLTDEGRPSYCAVHEIMNSGEPETRSLSFASLDEIASSEFGGEERETVLTIMQGEVSTLGRFARLGWIDTLFAKTGIYPDRAGWPVMRQLNQGIDFCLLSLTDATGHKVWFKAVGEPNTREYPLTLELARRFPAYLPKILATIPEWNGWVMEDVEGLPFNESDPIDQCKQALTALAIMQREMVGSVASLSAIGAKDWTCNRIASLSEPFFTEARRAMQAQSSAKAKPLGNAELYQLKVNIQSALYRFMNAGVPETLLHGDIGHGNNIATANGPVFLDWAETYIGHPFVSAEHLLADFERSHPHLSNERTALRLAYADHWREYATPEALANATAFAPAVAAFAYAVMAWEASVQRPNPTSMWPLLRSMLRRTKLELEQVPEVAA